MEKVAQWISDVSIDLATKFNDRTYYDHVGLTKNRHISGNWLEVAGEITMTTVASLGNNEEAAKHHANRAVESAKKATINEITK